ncbi:hypothetical protein N8702_01490 [Verrucomicrobia bacterium]|nr:hypothetical protein [Verrucomicrobiota bacterium]
MLDTQIEYAPKLLELEQQYAPQYAQLELDMLAQNLPQITELYSQYMPELAAAEAANRRAMIEGDLQTIQDYSDDVRMAVDPQRERLLSALATRAEDDMALGSSIGAEMERDFQQSFRQGRADAGFGYGVADLAGEAAFTAMQKQGMRNQRTQQAANIVNLKASSGVDPFMALLGRQSSAGGMMGGIGQQAQGMGAQGMQSADFGMNAYFQDLNNTNFNAAYNTAAANANASNAFKGAIIGAVGQAAGSVASAGFGKGGRWS